MKYQTPKINASEYLKIACVVILFAWVSFFPLPIQEQYGVYTRIFLGIFLLILILNKRHLRYLFGFQDWPLWLFVVFLSAGTVSAINRNVALTTYTYLTINLFLLFYIGKALYCYEEDRAFISIVICICSCLVALIGILELYFGKNILYENFIANPYYERYAKDTPRAMSTQFNPTVLGSYLLGCLPFNLYFLRHKSLYLRIGGILSVLLCTTVIILTSSRGVFLGLIALLIFFLLIRGAKKYLTIFISFLILFIIFSSCQKDIKLNRFGYQKMIFGINDTIISEYRFARINMTLKILKEHPFFGIGFNHFRIRFNEYYDKKGERELYEFMIPDNMYLTFLAETGVIGTSGFLIFLYFLIKDGLRQLRRSNDNTTSLMLLVVMSSLIGLLVNMSAYELFYWSNPFMFFCLICGFIKGFIFSNLNENKKLGS